MVINGLREDLSFLNTALIVKAPGGKIHLEIGVGLESKSSNMEIYKFTKTYLKKSNGFRKRVVT